MNFCVLLFFCAILIEFVLPVHCSSYISRKKPTTHFLHVWSNIFFFIIRPLPPTFFLFCSMAFVRARCFLLFAPQSERYRLCFQCAKKIIWKYIRFIFLWFGSFTFCKQQRGLCCFPSLSGKKPNNQPLLASDQVSVQLSSNNSDIFLQVNSRINAPSSMASVYFYYYFEKRILPITRNMIVVTINRNRVVGVAAAALEVNRKPKKLFCWKSRVVVRKSYGIQIQAIWPKSVTQLAKIWRTSVTLAPRYISRQ